MRRATGEAAEDGAPLSDADKANMFQAALQSLQIQLGEERQPSRWSPHTTCSSRNYPNTPGCLKTTIVCTVDDMLDRFRGLAIGVT